MSTQFLNGGNNKTNLKRKYQSLLSQGTSGTASQLSGNAMKSGVGTVARRTMDSLYKPKPLTGSTTSGMASVTGVSSTPPIATNQSGMASITSTTPPVATNKTGMASITSVPKPTGSVVPAPTTTPQTPASTGKYTVAKGDTLYALAKKYGTTVANLQAMNPGLNPNALQVGASLNVSGTPTATTTTPAPVNTTRPMVQNGSTGATVKELQQKLGITADGIFGPATKTALINYQKAHGLGADGIAGPKTWASLLGGTAGGGATTTAPAKGDGITTGSYEDLPSLEKLYKMAQDKAKNQFDNESLGETQLQEQYKQLIGQQLTDEQIRQKLQGQMDLKYDGQYLGLDQSAREAYDNYNNSMDSLEANYGKSKGEVYNLASNQRQATYQDAASRGLYNSTIVNNQLSELDKNVQSNVTALEQDMNMNVSQLDRQINTLMAGLNDQRNLLTQQEQTELVGLIQEMTKERDDTIQNYQQLINQSIQQVNQYRNNMTQNQTDYWNDMYGQFADLYRQDRDFNYQKEADLRDFTEDKRRWELDYALKKL